MLECLECFGWGLVGLLAHSTASASPLGPTQPGTHLSPPDQPCLPCCSNPNSMLSDPLLDIVRRAMLSRPPPCEGDAAASGGPEPPGGAAGTPPQAQQAQQGRNSCERSAASASSAASADRMAGCLTVALRWAGRCWVGLNMGRLLAVSAIPWQHDLQTTPLPAPGHC